MLQEQTIQQILRMKHRQIQMWRNQINQIKQMTIKHLKMTKKKELPIKQIRDTWYQNETFVIFVLYQKNLKEKDINSTFKPKMVQVHLCFVLFCFLFFFVFYF